MILETTVYVEHPDLALVPTVRSLDAVDLGVVSTAATDPENSAYVFWVESTDFEAFERRLEADHTVEFFSVLGTDDRRRTYRIEYSETAKLVTPKVAAVGGLVLDSRSHDDGWLLELELQGHEALDELGGFAADEGMQFEVLELHQTEDSESESRFQLTEPQVEALMIAYVHGYYDEPRDISLAGLGELLGISQSAVSGRLRRGSARLIEGTLIDEDE